VYFVFFCIKILAMSDNYQAKLYLNQIVDMLQNNKLDLIEGINNICNRIEEVEPHIHALKWRNGRRERLIRDAKELLQKFPDPEKRPPLFGVLVGIKDLFRVDGFPTKAGSKLPPSLFEGKEAVCVTKLKQAGALILGKTVTTEFAYFEPGPTRNPINPEVTPGGSSSGSAAAVAAGLCPITLGTQTIGSITRPASFCGIIGFKPSFGRVSTEGVISFSPLLTILVFSTQDLKGAKIIASVLCENWQNTTISDNFKKPVLAIPVGRYLNQAYKESIEIFESQVENLLNKAYKIIRINTFEVIESVNRRHRQMISAEIARVHERGFGNMVTYTAFTRNRLLKKDC
jgi:Asp-tRNA(Asn)/Glu-tRNA(Gln) amidotransferase A subunit family amidase